MGLLKKQKNQFIIAVAVAIVMIITGIVFITSSDSHTGHNGGVSRASTSIEFGADYYTKSAQYAGLNANAAVDIFELLQNSIGLAFIFSGLLIGNKNGYSLIAVIEETKAEETVTVADFDEQIPKEIVNTEE